jgi:hypothetical protein
MAQVILEIFKFTAKRVFAFMAGESYLPFSQKFSTAFRPDPVEYITCHHSVFPHIPTCHPHIRTSSHPSNFFPTDFLSLSCLSVISMILHNASKSNYITTTYYNYVGSNHIQEE